MWYSIFKLASIIFGGIVAALGEFFEYRKNGKVTKIGKTALLLFSFSVISAVVFSFLEDKKDKDNDALQEKRYKSNIDTIQSIAGQLTTVQQQYEYNSKIEELRYYKNLNKLEDIILHIQSENFANNKRHLQSLDSLSKITNGLLELNDKAISIISSTEKLNNASNEVLRDLERVYYAIEPLEMSFQTSLKVDKEKISLFLANQDLFPYKKYYNINSDTVEFRSANSLTLNLPIDTMLKTHKTYFDKSSTNSIAASEINLEIKVKPKVAPYVDIIYKAKSNEAVDLKKILIVNDTVHQFYKGLKFSTNVISTRLKNLNDFLGSKLQFRIYYMVNDSSKNINTIKIKDLQLSFGKSPKHVLKIENSDLKEIKTFVYHSDFMDRLDKLNFHMIFIDFEMEITEGLFRKLISTNRYVELELYDE